MSWVLQAGLVVAAIAAAVAFTVWLLRTLANRGNDTRAL